jgi:hypothetical protein
MNTLIASLYEELLSKMTSAPLGQTLPLALRLARELGDKAFEKWVRLELAGYLRDNVAMSEDVVVPEYRTVAGQHTDTNGRPLLIQDPKLYFVNEYRLRYGIEELEKMAGRTGTLAIQDPQTIQIIREGLKVDVHAFKFSPIAVSGILSNIRHRLSDWLYEIRVKYPQVLSSVQDNIAGANPSSNQSQQVHIYIGDGTSITGDFVIAHSIAGSFNKAESASISNELRDLLKSLAKESAKMSEVLPKEAAKQVAQDLETLTAETTSKTPRKRWWQLSAEGLRQAAQDVGEIGKPVLQLVAQIVEILSRSPSP